MARDNFRQEKFGHTEDGDRRNLTKRTKFPRLYYFPHGNGRLSTGHVAWMMGDKYLSHYPDMEQSPLNPQAEGNGGTETATTGIAFLRFPNEECFGVNIATLRRSKYAELNDDIKKYGRHLFADVEGLRSGGAEAVAQFISKEKSRSDSVYALHNIAFMASDGKVASNVKRSNCVTSSLYVLCIILCNMQRIPQDFLGKHFEFTDVQLYRGNFENYIHLGKFNRYYQAGHVADIVQTLVSAQK